MISGWVLLQSVAVAALHPLSPAAARAQPRCTPLMAAELPSSAAIHSEAIKPLASASEYQALVEMTTSSNEASRAVVIEFAGAACHSCRRMAPKLERFSHGWHGAPSTFRCITHV